MVVGVEGFGWLGCTEAELGGVARVVVVVAPWHGLGLQPVVGLGCPGLMPGFGGPAGWVGPGPCTCVGVGDCGPAGCVSSLPHFFSTGFQMVPGGQTCGGGVVVGPPVGGGVLGGSELGGG